MNAVPYHPSPSLVSLPMLTRPSTTATSLAISGGSGFGHHKRPRVNSKAAALGSLFRTKIHAKKNSSGGDSFSPPLGPLDTSDAAWNASLDYPLVSPLFTDESLQQLMGSSPPVDSQLLPGPVSPTSSSRRSKLESVLHNSAQPFRRLRSGPANKTLSFPPAGGESPAQEPAATDEFVVVTTDMCPPASLVSNSVISGVGAAEAQNAARAAASLDNNALRPGQTLVTGMPRMRAQTNLSKSTEHLLLRRMGSNGYADSSDSLVRISTPSLSASSSEASLPLGQGAAGGRAQMHRKLPAPLLTGIRPQHNLQLPANSALGNGFKPPLPGVAGSARKVSACSFSSLEDQRRGALHGPTLENLSPYTVNRLNTTAAKATERRRRSSVHRPRRMRTGSSASSGTWGLSAASDATLLADAASRPSHVRNMSDNSRLSTDYDLHSSSQQSFDFQIQSAVSESFWQHDESPLASDLDDDEEDEDGLAALHDASGFPSSCSAHFDFGPSSNLSPRPRAHTTANAARSPDALRFDAQGYPPLSPEAAAVLGMLDPSSPLYDDGGALVPLHMLTRSRSRLRRMSDVEPASPYIPEQFDYDGSTLTQQSDWLLMNPSSSDGEQSLQPQHRRRMRKRRVLPRTLFQTGSPKPAPGADEQMYRSSISTETLSAGSGEAEAKSLAKSHAIAEKILDATLAASSTPVAREEAATAAAAKAQPIVLTEDAVRMLELRIILRLPASIELHVHIECVGRLSLLCAGDSRCWQSARIACFAQRLNACLRGATGLRELALVNLGLTAVPKGIQGARGLQRLDLSHNWISAVPSWISGMAQLEHLVLRDNALRTVAADLVEMRHRLRTLDLGGTGGWAVLSRAMSPVRRSAHERSEALLARLHATAAKRMAACLTATQFSLTQRQHEASRDRATRLLAHYADSIYASLREPRSWGHSVALPFPSHT
ncbi:hypothetical protein LPJ56_000992 [Coemansia sp. RSA 2599]|nr:hypothetical protein LPJ56_000992 [Coemansia sp. RSA 2599]